MKFLFTSILSLFSGLLFGQSKILNLPISQNGDTTYWYKNQNALLKKISLPQLDTTSNTVYYRIWTDRQVLDIWQNPNGSFSGMLTNWTDEYPPYNEKPTNRTFVLKDSLHADTVDIIRQLILSSNILKLPTGDSIKGWQQGVDGIEYIIEYSAKDYYSFKTYWTPKAQDSLEEAKQVQTFIDSAFYLANAHTKWQLFESIVPFESYTNGISATVRITTEEQRKKYARERKRYRRKNHLAK